MLVQARKSSHKPIVPTSSIPSTMAEHQAQAQALNGVSANGVSDQPWYATYPKASSEPAGISRQEVLQLLKSNTAPGENFVLIDLRRTDYEVD